MYIACQIIPEYSIYIHILNISSGKARVRRRDRPGKKMAAKEL